MIRKTRCWFPWIILSAVLGLAGGLSAQPAVVATAEGQVGETPGLGGKVLSGPSFESIRGQSGEILLGGIFSRLAFPAPASEFSFLTDQIHNDVNPLGIADLPATFDNIAKLPPASARARNAADDGDFVTFSFAVDGTSPQTLTIRIATFDEDGNSLIDVPVLTNGQAPIPDPTFSDTGVAVDEQGRATVVYTELPVAGFARVKAQRLDAVTGLHLGGPLTVTDDGHAQPDIALLDPAGQRLIVPSSDFAGIKGNVVDLSGLTPQVLPEFPISTTPGFSNFFPSVAADTRTGAFTVVWENLTALVGDPVNVRARRFDAMGNPIGNDFVVNTTTANAQGQPAVAYGSGGESVVVWAGDAAIAQDELDVFAQVYDASGQPIGGEIKVNTFTENVQDQPAVRFLPESDGQGRSQFVVQWRDVAQVDGSSPRGTGISYRCFAVDGLPDQEIFADGFESGDTSSWSTENP